MVCRRVQLARPSSSTSGGQSGGEGAVVVLGMDWEAGEEEEVEGLVEDFIIDIHAAEDVHVLHLRGVSRPSLREFEGGIRLAIFI